MNENIIEGLKKLDPAADAHWTKEGEVNLIAFKFIMGGKSVTREQIEEVAPGFNRENTTIAEQSSGIQQTATIEGDVSGALSQITPAEGADLAKTGSDSETEQGEAGPGNVVMVARIELADALKQLLSLAAEKAVIAEMSDSELQQLRESFAERRDHNIEIQNCLTELLRLEGEFMHDVEKEYASRRKDIPLHVIMQAQYNATAGSALPVDRARPRAAAIIPPFRRS